MPTAEDFSNVESMQAYWASETKNMHTFLASMEESDLEKDFEYTTTNGIAFTQKVSDILLHVTLHGMQPRAEVAQMLTALGNSPGDIDYVMYLRQL